MPNQNETDGVWVEFFGAEVPTAKGPAILSLKTDAGIVPIFCRKVADDKYVINIYPEIEYSKTDVEDEDILNLTSVLTRVIEDEVRKCPDQWLWIHDRWKYKKENR